MSGHGYPQPVKQPPPSGWLVFLRVLFVVMSVMSCGLLTWTMLLRLAIVTRKALDWGLFVAVVAADILGLVLLGNEPGEDIHTPGGYTGLVLLLGTLAIMIGYYIAADIRHFSRLRQAASAGPQHPGYIPQQAPQAYGYPQPPVGFQPQPPSPYTVTPPYQPQPHTPVPQNHGQTPIPQPPVGGPPVDPPRPAPARIDQVRAELDELSDFLRRNDGSGSNGSGSNGSGSNGSGTNNSGGGHEGGR
ncbi:hypothetical protein [Streptomyces sp. AK08-02]|uniref:hypothetical protein n=1 Tax=Streptomyces sp. AK08-02 TaxID=3028654 RepID=UPI0029B90B1B|nr:hypothetical protein [Streptomyces sp. AK08-02]MDX3750507.1 hypothetical protein [Streptomyces sp. AK08-02]